MIDNNAIRLKRQLMIRICEMFMSGTIGDMIDRLPIELRPKDGQPARCCVYRDRALIKYRCMALLGFSSSEETDELTQLSEYAAQALQQQTQDESQKILSVMEEGCSACVNKRYFVTNACRGCLARPCTLNCPKQAIEIVDGQARIDAHKCVNCGKCMQVCPYHAIVYVPVPCEEVCPVGAITRSENGKQVIDFDKCIYCGKCMQACPFGAILEISELMAVLRALAGQRPVVALYAPALVGQFDVSPGQLVTALKQVGFDAVYEVASGADRAAVQEAEEFLEKMDAGAPFMTTSCCPAWTRAADKHLPELIDAVSTTPSPMHLTAEQAEHDMPNALKIFISPCVAKRFEATQDAFIDHVLTFEELGALFVAAGIEVEVCDEASFSELLTDEGRKFCMTGGVVQALARQLPPTATLEPLQIEGLDKKTIRQLKTFAKRQPQANFIEVMSCAEGCVGGTCTLTNPRIAARRIARQFTSEETDTCVEGTCKTQRSVE